MKKIFTLFITCMTLQMVSATVNTDTIVLDLTHPTDPTSFSYNATGEWTETFNDSSYLYFSAQGMNFSHLPSGDSWGGLSWEGFTPSISTDTITTYDNFMEHQWGCLAQGGVDGIGTPFLVAFYSDYYKITNQISALQVIFDTIVTPTSVYLCNVPYTFKCITRGHTIARAFTTGDSLTVIVKALDENYSETGSELHFDLANYRSNNANQWTLNTGWEKMNLSTLGKVYGLSFELQSSDQAYGYANTATYFAMDKLSYVKGEMATGINTPEISMSIYPNPFTDYIIVNCERSTHFTLYNQQGQIIISEDIVAGTHHYSTSELPAGLYIGRCDNQVIKLIK